MSFDVAPIAVELSVNANAGVALALDFGLPGPQGLPGLGDVTSNTDVSVDSEVVLFQGDTGKRIQRANATGIPLLTAGVLSIATSGSDYLLPSSVIDGGEFF